MSLSITEINETIARADGWTLGNDNYWRRAKLDWGRPCCPTYHRAENFPALLRVEREKLGPHWWIFDYSHGDAHLHFTASLFMGLMDSACPNFISYLADREAARADCVAQALAQQEKP